jgi:hypothetical protein
MYTDNHLFFEARDARAAGIVPFSSSIIPAAGQDCSIV